MTLVQIEDTELATLRQERNEARAQLDTLQSSNRELTTKVEAAEAAKVQAETAKVEAERKVTTLEEQANGIALRDKRMSALGGGFLAKLGETSKTVLTELAAKASDAEWDTAIKEREELAGVKRDVATSETPASGGEQNPGSSATAFSNEEVASFMRSNVAAPSAAPAADGATSVRQLARAFGAKPKTPTAA